MHQVDCEYETATFGMGCFWGADALFGATKGVLRTSVGYTGGTTENPTYKNLYVSYKLHYAKVHKRFLFKIVELKSFAAIMKMRCIVFLFVENNKWVQCDQRNCII